MTLGKTHGCRISALHLGACALFALTLCAQAAEPVFADTQLAAVQRQLDTIDRLAAQAEQRPETDRPRYHFDYARLRQDVQRVRAGVQDYLVPQRAQPRDPLPLVGDYVRSDDDDGTEVSKP